MKKFISGAKHNPSAPYQIKELNEEARSRIFRKNDEKRKERHQQLLYHNLRSINATQLIIEDSD